MVCYSPHSSMPQSDQVEVPMDRGILVKLAVFDERALEGAWALRRKLYDVGSIDVGDGMAEPAKPVMLHVWKLDLVQATANIRQRWETLTPEDTASWSDRGGEAGLSGHRVLFGVDWDAPGPAFPFGVTSHSKSH
jgi:hypothetical protein